mgnify:CR=1 FL=1
MSAIAAQVVDNDRIIIRTDMAATCRRTGKLATFLSKQFIDDESGIVVAGIGTVGPVRSFAKLAKERAKSFDELSRLAPELWAQVQAATPAGAP